MKNQITDIMRSRKVQEVVAEVRHLRRLGTVDDENNNNNSNNKNQKILLGHQNKTITVVRICSIDK